MCVSILLPEIDQRGHTAQVKGYSGTELDKRNYAGIPIEPYMGERKAPEGCSLNLSAFLSEQKLAVLLRLNLWCFMTASV